MKDQRDGQNQWKIKETSKLYQIENNLHEQFMRLDKVAYIRREKKPKLASLRSGGSKNLDLGSGFKNF